MEWKTALKTTWTWIDDRPVNYLIAAAVLLVLAAVWKPLLTAAFWFAITPGSFVMAYGVWRWWKKRKQG